MKCKEINCEKIVVALGLCESHYRKGKRAKTLPIIFPYKPRNKPGEGSLDSAGYVLKTEQGVQKREHQLIAEKVLGRALKDKEEVHHVDGNKANNTHTNLVVCPNRAYHLLLHKRQRAYDACGHADWIKCGYCSEYSSLDKMYVPKTSSPPRHKACAIEYQRNRRKEMKNEQR